MSRSVRRHFAAVILTMAVMYAWTGAHAMWAPLTDGELIKTSSLIVVGKLVRFATEKNVTGHRPRTVGVIEIDTVLKGEPKTKLVKLHVPQAGEPVSSSDIVFKQGQNGLWFLRLWDATHPSLYAADHPQRFVPFPDAGPRIEAVRKLLGR